MFEPVPSRNNPQLSLQLAIFPFGGAGYRVILDRKWHMLSVGLIFLRFQIWWIPRVPESSQEVLG